VSGTTATRLLTNEQTVRLGFAQLRRTCDPRGHDLLDALEGVCIEAMEIPEKVHKVLDDLLPGAFVCNVDDESAGMAEVVELQGYSQKVGCE